jgi:hypothetical protein
MTEANGVLARARRRSRIGAALVVVAVVVVLFVGALRPPTWWRPPTSAELAADPSIARTAEALEQGCIAQIHRVRPVGSDGAAEPWAIRILESEANAWCADRLPRWAEHAGVPQGALGDVQVRFLSGELRIAVAAEGSRTVLVATWAPRIESGRLVVPPPSLRVGRLPVPFVGPALFRTALAAFSAGDLEPWMRDVAAALEGGSIAPAVELVDGRSVQLRDLELRDGELVLQFATMPRE